jgi:hypothetical protein
MHDLLDTLNQDEIMGQMTAVYWSIMRLKVLFGSVMIGS